MSTKSKLSFFTRVLTIAAPIAVLAFSAGAAPVETLGASCSPNTGLIPPGQSCSSPIAQATITPNISFFGNGFTISLDEQGFATSINGVPAGFDMSADVPVDITISGPNRPVVIDVTYTGQIENLSYTDGTTGQITYGFSHFTVLTKEPDGGVGQNSSYSFVADPKTIDAISGPDFSSTYGLGDSVQLDAAITSGSVAAFVDLTQTVQIFEADGVTPVSLVSATPEPSSAMLILPGLFALYFVHRNRQSMREAR